jgi:hypothetical protein
MTLRSWGVTSDKEIHQKDNLWPQKTAVMIIPDGVALNFLAAGDNGCFHVTDVTIVWFRLSRE